MKPKAEQITSAGSNRSRKFSMAMPTEFKRFRRPPRLPSPFPEVPMTRHEVFLGDGSSVVGSWRAWLFKRRRVRPYWGLSLRTEYLPHHLKQARELRLKTVLLIRGKFMSIIGEENPINRLVLLAVLMVERLSIWPYILKDIRYHHAR